MITAEDIEEIYGATTGFSTLSGYGHDIAIVDFARAIYHLGRQHQRESDAALCREHARNLKEAASEWMNTQKENLLVAESCGAKWCSEAIRANTGELK